jgi:hypothetical protein
VGEGGRRDRRREQKGERVRERGRKTCLSTYVLEVDNMLVNNFTTPWNFIYVNNYESLGITNSVFRNCSAGRVEGGRCLNNFRWVALWVGV